MPEENAFHCNAAFVEGPTEDVAKTEHLILLNTFLINSKRHRVVYHSGHLVWEKEVSRPIGVEDAKCKANQKPQTRSVQISEIISVKLFNCSSDETPGEDVSGARTSTNSQNNAQGSGKRYLKITFAYRKCKKEIPGDKWRIASLSMFNTEQKILKTWYRALDAALKKDQKTPKNLIVFINPFGGEKKALHIYEKYAKPLFEMANIEVNCVISQRAHQITDLIMSMRLDLYDGICCVGGDGTFSEVFNGLLQRERDRRDTADETEVPKPSLPIGIIPAGSTDTVAYCLHNTSDIRTCVISIVLGTTKGLDLASVTSKTTGLQKFYASMFSYGFLGDVAWDSEKYRFLGKKRYDFSGFKIFLKNRGYSANMAILLDDDPNSTSYLEKCLEDCSHCTRAGKKPVANDCDSGDGENKRWKVVNGKFFMINVANISCACHRSRNGVAPFCHLGDGYMDITLVKHTSFWNNLRLLWSLKSGQSDQLSFVENFRTRQLQFRQIDENGSAPVTDDSTSGSSSLANSTQQFGGHHFDGATSEQAALWNCDGEVLDCSDLVVRSHLELIKVFRRGGVKQQSPTADDSSSSSPFCSICK